MSRYIVVEESVSGHCCFKASVLDTKNKDPENWNVYHDGELICECFETENAERIARLLNQADEARS